ncbi:hypothetical protein BKA69DRAFT_1076425 [Paraphysoderma sedebokerense]|nr:hypothetical protein BKA69DRAFT_1076425 [Paraphysoderma sedebokerense]
MTLPSVIIALSAALCMLSTLPKALSSPAVPLVAWSSSSSVPNVNTAISVAPSDNHLDSAFADLISESACTSSNGNSLLLVVLSQANVHELDLTKYVNSYSLFNSIKNSIQTAKSTVQVSYCGINPAEYLTKKVKSACDGVSIIERPWNEVTTSYLKSISSRPTILRLHLPPFDSSQTDNSLVNADVESLLKEIEMAGSHEKNLNIVTVYHGELKSDMENDEQTGFFSVHQNQQPLMSALASPSRPARNDTSFLATYVIFSPGFFMSLSTTLFLIFVTIVGICWLASVNTSHGLVTFGGLSAKKRQ